MDIQTDMINCCQEYKVNRGLELGLWPIAYTSFIPYRALHCSGDSKQKPLNIHFIPWENNLQKCSNK